ncbi:aspartate-alanine antiporter [Silvimonas soli]|uniref:aspartate-alanine antiporter n=1 Tax=Silvimonas soli TaxID=2980100 RepID=UPI0024B37BA8|nr:aspartate-alanine antiporter [Silvimonas soli]
MLEACVKVIQENPSIALFLALAIGHAVGAIRVMSIQLGGVCGTLLAALVIGQIGVVPDAGIKNLFFSLFIFALGFAGGPQFFANLNAKGLRLGLFCAIEIVVVLALVLTATRVLGLDQGTAAGLMAGSATESAVVGTASDAVGKLALPAAEITRLQANVVTAYSITYVFGLITIVVMTSQLFPLLLRVNVQAEAQRLWESMGGSVEDAQGRQAAPEIVGRVFRVTTTGGATIDDIEARYPGIEVERVLRDGQSMEISQELVLNNDDHVLITGRRSAVLAAAEIGPEQAETEQLNFAVETVEVIFNRRDLSGRTLAELTAKARSTGLGEGVHVMGITRGGQPIPPLFDVPLQYGDILRLYGSRENVHRLAPHVGALVDQSDRTDFTFASIGIVLGILIGMLSVRISGVAFSLGTGGGALLTGLVFGWYQARKPQLGHIPASAIALLKDLGLAVFIACVGLSSGPQALTLIHKYGFALPFTGVLIALVPALVSLLVGRYVLKLEAPVLLGAIAGQQCSTPALSAVVNVAGNTTPLLGYTITYAISNALLPLMGPLIVFASGAVVAH